MSRENVQVVRDIYEEWAKGNLRAGLDVYDRHVLFIPRGDLPNAGLYLGIEEVREWMRAWLDAWTEFTVTAEEFVSAGDSVLVAVRQHGLGKGSGVAAEVEYFQVWTFRGRSVTRIEQFADRADALEAMGLRE